VSPADPLLDRPNWAPEWLPTIDDLDGMRWLRTAIGVVLVAGLLAFVARGADQPADPVLGPPTTAATTTAISTTTVPPPPG
jgi:hypothetical protein